MIHLALPAKSCKGIKICCRTRRLRLCCLQPSRGSLRTRRSSTSWRWKSSSTTCKIYAWPWLVEQTSLTATLQMKKNFPSSSRCHLAAGPLSMIKWTNCKKISCKSRSPWYMRSTLSATSTMPETQTTRPLGCAASVSMASLPSMSRPYKRWRRKTAISGSKTQSSPKLSRSGSSMLHAVVIQATWRLFWARRVSLTRLATLMPLSYRFTSGEGCRLTMTGWSTSLLRLKSRESLMTRSGSTDSKTKSRMQETVKTALSWTTGSICLPVRYRASKKWKITRKLWKTSAKFTLNCKSY